MRPAIRPTTLFAVLLLLPVAAAPATRPGLQEVLELGSADPAVRSAATRRLWQEADAALPGLRVAAASQNPEAAIRARELIGKIEQGITPWTQPDALHFLARYPSTTTQDLPELIQKFNMEHFGAMGARVLLRLRDRETDSGRRAALDAALAQLSRYVVAIRLDQGQQAAAEAFLADLSLRNPPGATDYVGYWQARGQIRQRIADLGPADAPAKSRLLALLEQAAGDPAAANRAADVSGDPLLAQRLLIQQADWPGLERKLPKVDKNTPFPDAALRAFVAICAGDSATADRIVHLITSNQISKNDPPEPVREGYALCMLDRPADAERIMCDTGNLDDAFELMEARQEYGPALNLWKRGRGGDATTARLQARAASLAWSLGHADLAAQMLSAGLATNRLAKDATANAMLSHAAEQQGKIDLADSLLAMAMGRANDESTTQTALQISGIANPDNLDTWWWDYLQTREPREKALADLRRIGAGKMPVQQLRPLADAYEQWAQSQSPSSPVWYLISIASAWKTAGQPELALAVYQRAAEQFPLNTLTDIGDLQLQAHHWSDAADAYGQAADIDPADALAVMKQGWALMQAGDAERGKALIARAHLLPLADVYTRQTLIDFADGHGLGADADRERATLLKAGDVGEYGTVAFREPLADAAEAKGQYALAASYWDQVFATIIRQQLTFADPSANAEIPARLHRLRAQADFAGHKLDAGLAEARISWNDDPADADNILALIHSARVAGDSTGADELYRIAIADYAQHCLDNPGCADVQNGLAWVEARCHRDLDDALAHAQKAVALAPDNPAVLDTLAEVYYQRHDFQKAVSLSQQCVQLNPAFHDRLARFQLALKTGVSDNE